MVTYLTDGATKTSFADRAKFNVGEWQDEMLKLLHNLRMNAQEASNDVIALVNTLKTELEHQDALPEGVEKTQQGETFLFDGRSLHWGNASKDLRFVVYSQAVHRGMLDEFIGNRDLRKTVLTTYYSAEYVVDRRTIASPTFLHNLWLYNSPDVMTIQQSSIAQEAHDLWEKLSNLTLCEGWPSAVCQCCLNNDADIVLCTAKDCDMGAIHLDCIPVLAEAGAWKCSSCLASGQ